MKFREYGTPEPDKALKRDDTSTSVQDNLDNEQLGVSHAFDEVAVAADYDDVVEQSFPASDPPPSTIVSVKCTPAELEEKREAIADQG